ncbi:ATP-binding protein [Acaryochloris sp. CCMEE 5410]|uniref:ATP-binding protein n=1 Tax=Acaryochloris sp. CCMEE 5410 TaxID=310037 RepID=UPI0021D04CC4|nr:AAA family ATPase [Acaryochloris sp. CCMEE 5410]KAI9130402.1 ATP-binding protein [Acaryochloris sp. CCMEE 5410]
MQQGDAAWQEANWLYFTQALLRVKQALRHQGKQLESQDPAPEPIDPLPPSELSPPSYLEQISKAFGLSPFARDVLLLCVGMELDRGWESICALAHGNPNRPFPTLGLALTCFAGSDWIGLQSFRILQEWHLIEVGAGTALSTRPLSLDPHLLQVLLGDSEVDPRLKPLTLPFPYPTELVSSHQAIVDQIVQLWWRAFQLQQSFPIIQLCGPDVVSQQGVTLAACEQMGMWPFGLAAETLPVDQSGLQLIQKLLEREWLLHHRVIVLHCDGLDDSLKDRDRALAGFIDRLDFPLILLSRVRRPQHLRQIVTHEIGAPNPQEQQQVWEQSLGELTTQLNGQVEALVSHFNLSASKIREISHQFRLQSLADKTTEKIKEPQSPTVLLWQSCRQQARPRLDELAQRIESNSTWEDLVLPEKEQQVLKDIAVHVRQRRQVYEQWGFQSKSQRGLGIAALFAGASGTGKTLAAEVLANTLQLDVYRIDLSSVVSKYIGETEKNLRRVFDAAEGGGVILLFDEADALFGKRSEVKDSHDRHANIEVSYLLQRMEAYRGLAILTTNLKGSLDQAFLRRIRFIVQFPFPDAKQRAEIWQHIFPQQAPTQGLDVKKLAKLSVSGGNIRNIALNAAFLAADDEQPVGMQHLLQAARSEYVKLERPLTDAEVKGWV